MGTHASHTIFRPGHSGELRYRQENVWKIRLAMDQGLHGRWQDDEPTEEDDEPTEEDFKDEQEEVEQFYGRSICLVFPYPEPRGKPTNLTRSTEIQHGRMLLQKRWTRYHLSGRLKQHQSERTRQKVINTCHFICVSLSNRMADIRQGWSQGAIGQTRTEPRCIRAS